MNNNKRFIILLVLIACFGFFLRTFQMYWDHGYNLHLDERAIFMITAPLTLPSSIAEFFTPESPLNPKFFAYGSLPLYLLKLVSSAAGLINPFYTQYDSYWYIGRLLNALFDSATIICIALIAHKLTRNKMITLLSALLYSIAVLPIQTSHFYVVDLILTFFITATFYQLSRFIQQPSIKNSIVIGILFGCALATKTSALPLIIPIGVTFLLLSIPARRTHRAYKNITGWLAQLSKMVAKYGLIIMLFTVITFCVLEPYAFIDSETFIRNQQEQSQMTTNAFAFPYTLQYVGKMPYLYELKNIYWWGLGPVISACAAAGIILLVYHASKRNLLRKKLLLPIGLFSVVYFGIVGGFAVGWMRYMLPLYPIFCFASAYFLYYAGLVIYKVVLKTIHHTFARKIILGGLLFITGCSVFLWPLSFMSIYSETHPRIAATQWILAHIPAGSITVGEHWDDQLPLKDAQNYLYSDLPMYEPDTDEKWAIIQQKLNQAEYLILSSNRLYTPLMKLTDCENLPENRCYRRTAAYYQNLFSGNHEFKQVAEFSVYPTIPLLNIPINDQTADESFTVYDHPKVLIFKKSRYLDQK